MPANKQRGERALQGGGENFTLVLKTNAVSMVEDELGYGISAFIFNLRNGNWSVKEMRTILWGALLKHHGPLSLEDAGEILDDILEHYGDTGKVAETLAECVGDALPFPDSSAKGEGGSGNGRNPKVKKALPSGTRKKAGARLPEQDTEQD